MLQDLMLAPEKKKETDNELPSSVKDITYIHILDGFNSFEGVCILSWSKAGKDELTAGSLSQLN